jgi:hypothetical protein
MTSYGDVSAVRGEAQVRHGPELPPLPEAGRVWESGSELLFGARLRVDHRQTSEGSQPLLTAEVVQSALVIRGFRKLGGHVAFRGCEGLEAVAQFGSDEEGVVARAVAADEVVSLGVG